MRQEQTAILNGARFRMSKSRLDAAIEAEAAARESLFEQTTDEGRDQAFVEWQDAQKRHRRLAQEHRVLWREVRLTIDVPIRFL